ncbi:MAG: hypothetical protein HN580_22920 [Deltaproteobacteria bacterium]|jgi:hypothetical protein|nr:hypothetical protein [Deltaproteobacteria bacterium]MBT4267037.1 hypothetical protein [Deltaproteobacteria bacterium]MBT4641920.1 hypothetical protein [Deltaproteobacteria bacterium]MBT6505114.1 hypothetical protein [Deltaproteobacteria bacterium]MBT6611166.1 hypothetical protein [Deltaproteobacteria bacterium]
MTKKSNQTDRIKTVLKECDTFSVSKETLQAYFLFLSKNLSLPCDVVTANEYERYKLDLIDNSKDEFFGLLGKVRLLSDEKKHSIIPLCDLKAANNRSENFEMLNDYAAWFINHQ